MLLTKTLRSRHTIALDPAAVVALRRHRVAQASNRLAVGAAYDSADRVFADEIGRALTPGNVSVVVSAAVKRANLPTLTLHGLRVGDAIYGRKVGAKVDAERGGSIREPRSCPR